MMKNTAVTLSVLSTLLHSTTAFVNYVVFNANSSGPTDGYQTFSAADRMPNETHAVTWNYASNLNQNWTWTVKSSNVLMPNLTKGNVDDAANWTANGHVAYTTYDFSWPQGGSLNAAVKNASEQNNGAYSPSCMYMLWANFPLNVSAKYDPSSSDCTSALGAECVKAITGNISASTTCSANDFPSYSKYRDVCADSFGAIDGDGLATQGYRPSLAFGNATAASNATSLQSGSTWAWTLSYPYAADNTTAFETEKEKLRVIAVSTGGQNRLLCNRVSDTVENAASPALRIQGMAVVVIVAMVAAVMNAM
ncbi:hypothetical protein PRZ48_006027 [Zasmidium cellare]|uniref:Uncharacterized protein n=1 Tax=Zasmidium cellare TaxID=395010 RepID=A0ABR0EMV2_ZASCE|nr:hypothetical protein PRZ48_006027 [Zasmidium cellare]